MVFSCQMYANSCSVVYGGTSSGEQWRGREAKRRNAAVENWARSLRVNSYGVRSMSSTMRVGAFPGKTVGTEANIGSKDRAGGCIMGNSRDPPTPDNGTVFGKDVKVEAGVDHNVDPRSGFGPVGVMDGGNGGGRVSWSLPPLVRSRMHGDAAMEDTAAMAARSDGRDRDAPDVERRKGTSMGSDRGIKTSKSVADKPGVSTNGIPKQCKYNRRSTGSLRIVHMEWSNVEPSIVGPEKAKMTAIAASLSVGGA